MTLSTTSVNLNDTKMTVKWFEISIQKFNVAVPHFVEMIKVHNLNLTKFKRLNDWEEVQREHSNALRTIRQLSSLLSEMDSLRNQVVDTEISKFDKLINQSKQSALSAIQSNQDIHVQARPTQYSKKENLNVNEEEEEQRLHIVADITEEIKIQEQTASSVERIQEDVQDIHSLFEQLSQLVNDQGENVGKIEANVDTSHHNVLEGETMLCQAAKYKNGMFPLLGALIGSAVGGPIGLLAGFKLGSLTAVGCGILGFTGGKILKNQNEITADEAEHHRQELIN